MWSRDRRVQRRERSVQDRGRAPRSNGGTPAQIARALRPALATVRTLFVCATTLQAAADSEPKRSQGGDRKSSGQNDHLISGRTEARLGDRVGVSSTGVRRAAGASQGRPTKQLAHSDQVNSGYTGDRLGDQVGVSSRGVRRAAKVSAAAKSPRRKCTIATGSTCVHNHSHNLILIWPADRVVPCRFHRREQLVVPSGLEVAGVNRIPAS